MDMEWWKRMNTVLDYIEDNLDGEIQDNKIAALFVSSQGVFQRFFSMITEMPLSEYIRKRRLTQAAHDIMNTDVKIIDVAVKFNYDSAKAFSTAFKQFHGITPSEARMPGMQAQSFQRFTFAQTLSISGGSDMQIANVSEKVQKKMWQYMGDESDAFFTRANSFMAKYADLWKLTNIRPISPASDGNIVFSCDSELYGACVLYMYMNGVENEVNFLNIYGGKGYCKLYAYGLEDNVLLVERITPGICLWDAVVDYRERARIVAELVKDLPVPHEIGDLPTYGSWMEGIRNILTEMGGLDDVLFYLNKAMEIYVELKQRYPRNCLLDANLQRFNLFLNESGGFTITDPQSVVDDPIMLTARFLNNETPNTLMNLTPNDESRIREMAAIIGSITEVSADDVLKSMFIDDALSNCWTLDEFYHFPKREGLEETKKNVLKSCGFVYGLIQSTM